DLAVALQRVIGKDRVLVGAVGPGNQQIPERRVVPLTQKGEVLAIRRKCHRAIDVAYQDLRSTAKYGSAVENGNDMFGFIAPHEVDIGGVAGKRESVVACRRWRHDFCAAARGNVAKPERLESVFLARVQEVFAVRRQRCQSYGAILSKTVDF